MEVGYAFAIVAALQDTPLTDAPNTYLKATTILKYIKYFNIQWETKYPEYIWFTKLHRFCNISGVIKITLAKKI